jgi:hypothetical protein
MSGCNTCSTSGPQPLNCNPTATQVPWDGGALCTGFSGNGSVVDAIQDVANAVCALSGSSFSLPIDDTDVNLTGSPICITPTPPNVTVADWILNMETDYCALKTAFNALDFTEPVDFNNTPVALTNAAVYGVLDTITIPKNTLNATGEYLEVEVFISTDSVATANSKFKLTFAGTDAVVFDLLYGTIMKVAAKATVKLTRLTSSILCVDWEGIFKVLKASSPLAAANSTFGLESNVTGLDFTVSNNITIEGLKTTGVITMSRSRTTKFNIH